MASQEDIQKKLKKKRGRELLAYFREISAKEGFFAAVKRTLRYLRRRRPKKRGRFLPKRAELERQRTADVTGWPKISLLVPVYNPTRQFLDELLGSVARQTYQNWEMYIANASDDRQVARELAAKYADSRIQVVDVQNEGISANTNAAARKATGQYIAFADHDDILAPNAFFEIAQEVALSEAQFIYSDEALFATDCMNPSAGHFKPAFSPQYLLNVNYMGHLVAVKRTLFDKLGGLRGEFDGSQDYDFNLRATEEAGGAAHIDKVLYYWRQHEQSTSTGVEAKPYVVDAAKRAIDEHLERINVRGTAVDGLFPSTYKVDYAIKGRPFISIIIPNSEHIPDLDRCIRSIYKNNHYKQFEVIVVENNSTTVETFSYYQKLTETYPQCKVMVYEEEGPFNFSAICNFGRTGARGEYLLFLNNDIEVATDTWLDEMLQLCQLDEVGVVGAMLYYPDDTVQHAGVITGLGGYAAHSHKYAERGHSGYMFRQACVQELSAVTGACMMVKARVFNEVGGFDAKFSVAYNDVDFCLRVRKTGKSVLFTPYAELYHYESKSRGSDEKGFAAQRFAQEKELLWERYSEDLLHDPFYNHYLTLDREDFSEADIMPEA